MNRSVRRAALRCLALLVLLAACGPARPALAQRISKYGAEFLAGGVGARALGMGGTSVALARDVTAGYWNAAGLSGLAFPEAAYMHTERFSGVVSFDYGAVAFPLNARSTFGVSLVRLGVDDIANTLDAWDAERDQPRPNPEDHITRFSYAHYAVLLSYARSVGDRLALGVTAKVIHGGIGDLASSWGYSFDAAAQYRLGRLLLGASLQDASTMLQSWSVNRAALGGLEDFGQLLPEGGTELVLPVARLGSGFVLPAGPVDVTLGLDVDVAFDGRKAYTFNAGDLNFRPRFGTEVSYRNVVAFRAGVNEITTSERYGTRLTPTVGVGLNLQRLAVDYGFGDFAGMTSELGYSHRLSLRLTLASSRLARQE